MKTMDVDLFLADIRDHDCEAMTGLLRKECRERLARISHPRRRAQFILGRHLLEQALRRCHGDIAKGWQLVADRGKPRLIGEKTPEISLSHSRELVACALARVEIGLDVEYCRERDFAALAAQICSPEEVRQLRSLPDAEQGMSFYRMWTLNEATYKLYGGELPALVDTWRHEYFQPKKDFIGALVARSVLPLRLSVHSL